MSTSGSANISAAHAVMSNSARRSSIKATQTTASTTSGEYPDVAPPWLSRNAAIAAMPANRRREREPAFALRADPGESGASSEDQTRERDVAPVTALGMDRERAHRQQREADERLQRRCAFQIQERPIARWCHAHSYRHVPAIFKSQVPRSRQCAPLAGGHTGNTGLASAVAGLVEVHQHGRDSPAHGLFGRGDRACGR